MGTLFGKFAKLVLTELAKEMAKPEAQREAEAAARDEKLARKRKRLAESMRLMEEARRALNERQESERRAREDMAELRRSTGSGVLPFGILYDRYVTDAIALVRPYPPHRAPVGRSHIGGLPDLPPGTAWPINAQGLPLHFLAQVDLAELQPDAPRPAGLPERGTLLFFARMDREMFFDEGDPVRILFDAGSSGIRTEAPAMLDPVDDAWERGFALDGETAPNTLLEWPWQLAGVRSLPTAAAIEHNGGGNPDFAEYAQGVMELREREIERTTGLVSVADDHWPDLGLFAPRSVAEPWQLLPFEATGFPWTARGMALVCRAVGKRVARREKFDALAAPLTSFLAHAECDPPAEAVAAEEANALIRCLNAMMAADYRDHVRGDGTETKIYGDAVRGSVKVAAHRLIAESGGSAALAEALPEELYRHAYPRHAPLTRRGDGQYVRHSQMFGHMPSSQDPHPASSPLLTLIQFASDPGIDLVIGDMGEININITPEALAERRWNEVKSWHVGG